MNSIQRVLAALTFGKSPHGTPDRVPVFPVPLMQGALVYNCTVEQYFAMPASKIADAQVQINKMFDGIPDGVAGIPHVIEDVTAFGVGLHHYYANCTPTVERMLINDFKDISSLRCPKPEDSAQLSKTLHTIADLKSKIGGEKVVIGACVAPFSLPSLLMGTEKWMRLLYTESLRAAYLDHILNVCGEFVTRWANAQLAAGAHVIVMADGMASATVIHREIAEEHAFPLVRKTIKAIKGMVAYEPVGVIEPFIDACTDLGAVAILIGQEDNIARCKAKLRDKVGLIGNINNMKMRRWSPARIELQAKAALAAGKPGYGFVLANQGPEIPFDVSVDRIAALIQSVEKHGQYDQPQIPSRKPELALAS